MKFKLSKTLEIFSFISPLNLEGNRFLGVTTMKGYNSALKTNEEKNRYSIYTPELYEDPKTIERVNNLFNLEQKKTGSVLFTTPLKNKYRRNERNSDN